MVYLQESHLIIMPKAPLIKRVHPKEKRCKHCKQTRQIDLFELKPTEASYRNICRPCRNYAKRTLRRLKNNHIKQYGKPDSGPCRVCERHLPLVFDHCHKSLRFRGWICKDCNAAIGKLGDDLAGVERALTYLREFDTAQTLLSLSGVC